MAGGTKITWGVEDQPTVTARGVDAGWGYRERAVAPLNTKFFFVYYSGCWAGRKSFVRCLTRAYITECRSLPENDSAWGKDERQRARLGTENEKEEIDIVGVPA